ncbi:hypothetical protein V8C37DRAFT_363567 [Trichoderma ceciliae]
MNFFDKSLEYAFCNWDAESIFFMLPRSNGEHAWWYILLRPHSPGFKHPNIHDKISPGNPVLLSFAKLLIEIINGERVPMDVDMQNIDKNVGNWAQMCGYVEEARQDGNSFYLQAVEGCLYLHMHLKSSDDSQANYSTAIATREAINEQIVRNLEMELHPKRWKRERQESFSDHVQHKPSHILGSLKYLQIEDLQSPNLAQQDTERPLINPLPHRSTSNSEGPQSLTPIPAKLPDADQDTLSTSAAYSLKDSGYASTSTMEREFGISKTCGNQAEQDFDDTATEYSNESISTLSKKQSYIMELVDDLVKSVGSFDADQETQTRISAILPELLKGFALKVGYNARTQMHRDIMAFVQRHRCKIAEKFTDISFEQDEDRNRISINVDGMSLDDRMSFWIEKDHQSNDLAQAGVESPDKDITAEEPTDEDLTFEAELEEEEATESWLLAYREFFANSKAYEWLLTRLRREFNLAPTESNTIQEVRSKIISSLPSVHRISRRASPQSYRAVFKLDWDILEFFESQKYSKQPEEVFEGVITLTGSCLDAQAATCAQYIQQTWPLTGGVAIELIKEVLRSAERCSYQRKLPDGTEVKAWIKKPKFMVEIYGGSTSIAETGEQLAWLGAALRTSPRLGGLIYCVPTINNIIQSSTSLQKSEFQPSANNVTFEIKFAIEDVPQSLEPTNGQCWHGIFRNPVVVKGYPIPQRSEWNTGLEISLNIMAGLARTRRIDQFKDKIYIKGFSTMLIPTKKNKDIVCWHLIYKKDESRISYLDDNVDREQNIGGLELGNFRHVLGWCLEAKYQAGSAEAHHPVAHSGLPKPHADCALAGMNVSVGKMIMNGPEFYIGVKDTPVYISRKGNVWRLNWISTKFILLWDERDKRGWLVNGASALLHIVRAFLAHSKVGPFRSVFCFKSEDLQEAEGPHTASSAIAMLINPHNRRLKLYEEDDGDDTYLRTQIDHFYNLLEKLIDHQEDIAKHCSVKLRDRPRRYLEGWDFEDIVRECSTLYPRVATISASGKGWVDFIRAIHAVTLVGCGFGDIIQPAGTGLCQYWAQLPTERYYIASCVSDLDRLMKENGSHPDGHALLSDNLIYHTPTAAFMPCQCRSTLGQKQCEPVCTLLPSAMSQDLLPRKPPVRLGGSGAVIFGYNSHFSWVWGDTGPPQQGELIDIESSSKAIEVDTDSIASSSSISSGLKSFVASQSKLSSSTENSITFSSESTFEKNPRKGIKRKLRESFSAPVQSKKQYLRMNDLETGDRQIAILNQRYTEDTLLSLSPHSGINSSQTPQTSASSSGEHDLAIVSQNLNHDNHCSTEARLFRCCHYLCYYH